MLLEKTQPHTHTHTHPTYLHTLKTNTVFLATTKPRAGQWLARQPVSMERRASWCGVRMWLLAYEEEEMLCIQWKHISSRKAQHGTAFLQFWWASSWSLITVCGRKHAKCINPGWGAQTGEERLNYCKLIVVTQGMTHIWGITCTS